jgi:bromodomain-containing factor 1
LSELRRNSFPGEIADLEARLNEMKKDVNSLKKKPKKEKKEKKVKYAASPSAGPSKPAKIPKAQPTAPAGKKRGKKGNADNADNDVLSFEQKKALSEAIQTLDGAKLERVIQIIHEGMPAIRDVSSSPVW